MQTNSAKSAIFFFNLAELDSHIKAMPIYFLEGMKNNARTQYARAVNNKVLYYFYE